MKPIRTALVVFAFWTVVAGVLYPLLVTGIGAAFFPRAATGSLVARGGKPVGSRLLAQETTGDAWFHPRPSAVGYNATSSGASNQGHTSAQLAKDVAQRTTDWKKEQSTTEVPPEMVTASGSGLDPEISPRAAELQVARIAAARHLSAADTASLGELVRSREQGPQLGFLGEPRVNVLDLNLALDAAFPGKTP